MDANDQSRDTNAVNVNDANTDKQSSSASTGGKSDPALQYYLAGKQGQIASLEKVTCDVRCQMLANLEQIKKGKNEKAGFDDDYDEMEGQGEVQGDQEVAPSPRPSKIQCIGGNSKRKASASQLVGNIFAPRTTPGCQPTLKNVFPSKEAVYKAELAIARWIIDARIPFSAIQSPYFQSAMDGIAAVGPGYKGPSYDELRGHLLEDLKKECQLLVDRYRSSWTETGCTLMADGWTDQRQRTLINFLVYCPAGMSFVRSVDASDMVKNATTLFNLFIDVIEWVGPRNIVHLVTDNAANYVLVGKRVREKYDHIFWSPCAACCINLILKDIASMPLVADLASRASKITVFVYNHMIFLSWLRRRPSWKEIVQPGATRFATVFITLKNIYEHKEDLQALVVDKHFTGHKLGRSANGKVVSATILDNKFWQDCFTMVKIVGPLVRLLRIVDADERPSLGYVYEGMQRAKNAIKKMFKNRKNLYKPYTEIIKIRWDKHLKHNLHASSYFLNPAFFYDEGFIEKPRVMRSLLDLFDIKSLCRDPIKAMKEIQIYRQRKQNFGRPNALEAAKSLQPSEWWRIFGGCAPNLQKIACRILNQTASASGCERNWSLFEKIHSKRRNRLEHQRLSDIVYVTYNLRLKSRLHRKKRNYDPIDFESSDTVDFWVMEDDVDPEFANEDIETLIYNDSAIPSYPVDGGVDVDVIMPMPEHKATSSSSSDEATSSSSSSRSC